jgi:hypothetical protein
MTTVTDTVLKQLAVLDSTMVYREAGNPEAIGLALREWLTDLEVPAGS